MPASASLLQRCRPALALIVTGIGLGAGIGLSLGTAPDKSIKSCSKEMQVASSVIGWSYFAAWSISFYPQVLLNYQRRSVAGFSLDYAVLNVCGYACYSAYNVALAFSADIRSQYAHRHHGNVPIVRPPDVFFALHALALSIVTYTQSLVYPRGGQRVALWVRLSLSIVGIALLVGVPLVAADA